jgi:hypothetical protein
VTAGALTATSTSTTSLTLNGNTVGGAANPTGTIGLTAVNGSASTYIRSDGAPALSQAIAPTWNGLHIFSRTGTSGGTALQFGAARNANSGWYVQETGAAANNRLWDFLSVGETLSFRAVNDIENVATSFMNVDRTGTAVDRVHFPDEDGSPSFLVGTLNSSSAGAMQVRNTVNNSALAVNTTGNTYALKVHSEPTSGDNLLVTFLTEAGGGTQRGSIDFDRVGVTLRYKTTSDQRLKKNFKPAPSARSVIDCVKIESFDWKESGQHVEHGVVAQRLNKCAPYAVSKGDVWQVDKSTLIPAMIKYMQEQDARISKMEAQLSRMN